jgi:Flp pilus assembly protein TadG
VSALVQLRSAARDTALLRRAARDTSGAAALEFAMAAPLLFLMIFGTLQMAHTYYIKGVLTGAVNAAARNSSLQSGPNSQATIDAAVTKIVKAGVPSSDITFTRKNYAAFSKIGKPEDYTDTNTNGVRDPGECFTDMNGNSTWDSDMGKSGLGGADDAVVYTVSISYTPLFAIGGFWGLPKTQKVNSTTILQNQPFSTQSERIGVKVCT